MGTPNGKSVNTRRGLGVGAGTPIRPYKFEISVPVPPKNLVIFGVTMDSSSNPLAGCTVKLYNTVGDIELNSAISDGSGNYSFTLQMLTSTTYYLVAYLPGSPDVAGTTVNTLIGA